MLLVLYVTWKRFIHTHMLNDYFLYTAPCSKRKNIVTR